MDDEEQIAAMALEEQIAAMALSDMLVSTLLRAYDENPQRTFLYIWERNALRWLLRFKERRPDGIMNAWTASFADLNRAIILADGGEIDFNLRAARIAREQAT